MKIKKIFEVTIMLLLTVSLIAIGIKLYEAYNDYMNIGTITGGGTTHRRLKVNRIIKKSHPLREEIAEWAKQKNRNNRQSRKKRRQ